MACASLDSTSDMDHPVSGILALPLAFNTVDLNTNQEKQARRKLNRRIPLLKRELADRPIRHGNRNYVGMLHYRLGDKIQAIECWEMTVKEDPTNLNAIQDLCTAYAKIGLQEKSNKWLARLNEVKHELSRNPDNEKRVYARCKVEQAFATCWDLHRKTWSDNVTEMVQIVQSFKSALEYARSLISKDEKEDWHLAIGQAYERLAHRYKRKSNMTEYVQAIDKAARYLHLSITSSHHTLHKMEAWCVLGNALTYDSGTRDVSIPDFIKTHYRQYWDNPSLCYDEALSLDPGNSWILGNYGHLLTQLRKYPEAIEKLDESIQNDPSSSSWFSYDNRSKAYKELAKHTRNHQRKKRYLDQASEDSKMADTSNPNPRTTSLMGEIEHGMAALAVNDEDKKRHSLQALGHFAQSFEIQDGMKISDAHFKQGKCLLEQDRWSAIQSFKMAYSTGQHSVDFQKSVASKFLLPNHLQHYKDEQKPKNLCAELAYWITDASVRHPCMASIFESLGKLARRDFQEEILDVLQYIVENQPNVQGVWSIIANGFSTMRKTSFTRKNFERLCDLEELHTTRMHSSTFLGADTPLPDHRPPQRAKNPNCENDFYVITPEEGTPWVQYFLLPGMECNFHSFKGFYQDRDTVIGQLQLKSQAEAISKSASVLVVHTQSFSSSSKCQHLFEIACKQKKSLHMAVLKLDNTPIAPQMAHIVTRFDFTGSGQAQVPSRWFDLAEFLQGKPGSYNG